MLGNPINFESFFVRNSVMFVRDKKQLLESKSIVNLKENGKFHYVLVITKV